jgi:hypothetical protein
MFEDLTTSDVSMEDYVYYFEERYKNILIAG